MGCARRITGFEKASGLIWVLIVAPFIAIGIGRILKGGGRMVAIDLSNIAVAVASYNVEIWVVEYFIKQI
ncbi:unnamed protein product [Victoria cruziana]